MFLQCFNLRIPYYVGGKELFASAIMVWGFAYRKSGLHIEEFPLVTIPVCLIIVVLGSRIWPCAMLSLTWGKALPYAFSALSGSLMVFSLCKLLSKQGIAVQTLSYIGDRTIDILTWHFLSFKLVSLAIVFLYGLSITRLAEFPVIDEFSHQGWWLAYMLVGVYTPLGIKRVIMIIRSRKQ